MEEIQFNKRQQFSNWLWTYNNYPSDLTSFDGALSDVSSYSIYGKEVGDSGTPHLQGYFQLKEKSRLSGLTKLFPGVHFIPAKGTPEQNITYCSKEKEKDLITERGTIRHTGKRKGLEEVALEIAGGKSMYDIATQHPGVFARYGRGLRDLKNTLSSRRRDFKTRVRWFYGPTGTGKSHAASLASDDIYYKPPTTKWWDGYTGNDTTVIDDYRRDFATFAELLRLFDRYPFYVEQKCAGTQFISRTIIVTTPKSPQDTWVGRDDEDIEQLLRRIEDIIWFKSIDETVVMKGSLSVDPGGGVDQNVPPIITYGNVIH